jgi:hypothetical protein
MTLFPLVDRERQERMMEKGHAAPKQINIASSNMLMRTSGFPEVGVL